MNIKTVLLITDRNVFLLSLISLIDQLLPGGQSELMKNFFKDVLLILIKESGLLIVKQLICSTSLVAMVTACFCFYSGIETNRPIEC